MYTQHHIHKGNQPDIEPIKPILSSIPRILLICNKTLGREMATPYFFYTSRDNRMGNLCFTHIYIRVYNTFIYKHAMPLKDW